MHLNLSTKRTLATYKGTYSLKMSLAKKYKEFLSKGNFPVLRYVLLQTSVFYRAIYFGIYCLSQSHVIIKMFISYQ